MKVCVCFNVSDRQIADALAAGESLSTVLKSMRVGQQCAKCHDAIRSISRTERAQSGAWTSHPSSESEFPWRPDPSF
jgi:bacterioferritin-associated ferredoxin